MSAEQKFDPQEVLVVRIIGGLGNQMFQYAAGFSLSERLNKKLLIDTRSFQNYTLHDYGLNVSKISAEVANHKDGFLPSQMRIALFERIPIWQPAWYYKERSLNFDNVWTQLQEVRYISGYFQSEQYFLGLRNKLQQEFSLLKSLNEAGQSLLQEVQDCESVAMHIRRGDYVSNAETLRVHGVCSVAYYQMAVDYVVDNLKSPKFFIFSNDFNWVLENLKLPKSCIFVDGVADHPAEDLFLMSRCQNHIIANSSFSWWGAWLSDYVDGIKIAPTPWYDDPTYPDSDLLPAAWIKLPK